MTFRPGSEDAVQRGVIDFLKLVIPGCAVVHVPNGAYFGGDPKARAHMARLKGLGLTPGAADLVCFPGGGRVFWIECKRPVGGRVSPEQRAFGDDMHRLGVPWAVCRGTDDVASLLHTIDVRTRIAV